MDGYHESPVRLVLKEIGDIERVLSRVALGSARPRDLVQLRQACAQVALFTSCHSTRDSKQTVRTH